MTDGYWSYADPRQQVAVAPASAPLKRPRPEYGDMPSAPEMHSYYPRTEDNTAHGVMRDTGPIHTSYDPYHRNEVPSYPVVEPIRPIGGANGHPVDGPRLTVHTGIDSRAFGFSGGRMEVPLPPDASNTLFVEGLPAGCARREVSHIFRPFVGFQEVRLVNKESKHSGREPFVLCFVDFTTPGQAAVALDALQGYMFDEHDQESARLRLQFARFPGPRSSGGPRSRR